MSEGNPSKRSKKTKTNKICVNSGKIWWWIKIKKWWSLLKYRSIRNEFTNLWFHCTCKQLFPTLHRQYICACTMYLILSLLVNIQDKAYRYKTNEGLLACEWQNYSCEFDLLHILRTFSFLGNFYSKLGHIHLLFWTKYQPSHQHFTYTVYMYTGILDYVCTMTLKPWNLALQILIAISVWV